MCTYTKTLAGTTPANRSIQSTKHRQDRQACDASHIIAGAAAEGLRRAIHAKKRRDCLALEDEYFLVEKLATNLHRDLKSAKHRQERKALKVALALAELLADYLRRRMDCRRADLIGSETA